MREIEFRGKRHIWETDELVWVYGFYDGDEIISEDGDSRKVNDDSVCQYIGLKDKNGVKIYEGDVLKFSWMRGFHLVESFHVVRFCENAAAFKFWDGQTWSPFWGFSDEDMEVVGNIFDDPEFNERFGTPYRELE